MSALIDRASYVDAEALADLLATAMPPGWPPGDIAASCRNPNRFVFKASDGAGVLGLAIFQVAADEAELLVLAVSEDARRLGTGSRLLQAGLLSCKQRGASKTYLEVAEENSPAFRLYRKHGFEAIAQRKNYYRSARDGTETALIMRLDTAAGVEQIALTRSNA